MHASIQGHEDVVRALLDAGADKSLKDYAGKTAAEHAAEKGNQAIVTLLQG
jgi:ankyrin repeat protein